MLINGLLLRNAMDAVTTVGGPDAAAALKLTADTIDRSGNNKAADSFNAFNEELLQPAPRKNVLKSSWNDLVEELPAIASLAGAPTTIVALFA